MSIASSLPAVKNPCIPYSLLSVSAAAFASMDSTNQRSCSNYLLKNLHISGESVLYFPSVKSVLFNSQLYSSSILILCPDFRARLRNSQHREQIEINFF